MTVLHSSIMLIERKLRYLVMVSNGGSLDYSTLLVHIYLSSKKNEVLVLAKDPVLGKIYKLLVIYIMYMK